MAGIAPDHPADDTTPEEHALRSECARIIDDWVAVHPEDDRGPWDVDATIFEAQVLLVCEEIRRGNMTDRRIQRALFDIRQGKYDDILGLVRLRLFERTAYLARLKSVETVFDQLVEGEMSRTVTRPAKYTPRAQNPQD